MPDINDTETSIVFDVYTFTQTDQIAAIHYARDMFNRDHPEQPPMTSVQYLMWVFTRAVESYKEQASKQEKLVSVGLSDPVPNYEAALSAWQEKQNAV